jgi:hypothetical protein
MTVLLFRNDYRDFAWGANHHESSSSVGSPLTARIGASAASIMLVARRGRGRETARDRADGDERIPLNNRSQKLSKIVRNSFFRLWHKGNHRSNI